MRNIVLIIDGLGVGAMQDVPQVRPQDSGANTLKHIAEAVGGLQLPFLEKLGLGNLGSFAGLDRVDDCIADYGKCMLAHVGADTYMGHQEMMGSYPAAVVKQTMSELSERFKSHLEGLGYRVEYPFSEYPLLLVDNGALIADNMEADPGQTLIVTCSLDEMDFDDLLAIGMPVRELSKVSRVIVGAGRGFDTKDILANITTTETTVGVDMPKLGIFNEHLQVRHLGFPVDITKQMPTIAANAGHSVVILGKAADVVQCKNAAVTNAVVDTSEVFNELERNLAAYPEGLFICNVQQSDHSGHEQDPKKYERILKLVDERVESLYRDRRPEDYLIITGDHGNDPTIGHSQHTRELTPLLVVGSDSAGRNMKTRTTLADVAATICVRMGLPQPEYGTSWL